MATPVGTIKQETITLALEEGKGTVLVKRPGIKTKHKQYGAMHAFEYTGVGSMPIMDAIAIARRKVEAIITQADAAAAAPSKPATKPAATAPIVDEETADPAEGDASLPTVPDEEAAEETDAETEREGDAETTAETDEADAAATGASEQAELF